MTTPSLCLILVLLDEKYAQQQKTLSLFLLRLIPLQIFDKNASGSGPVIHCVYIIYVHFGHKFQLTRFFLIDIFQFPIIINLPWMKNKFITIKLKFDISTIDFEQFDKTVTSPETMETNSLAKVSNSGQFSSLLLSKTGN